MGPEHRGCTMAVSQAMITIVGSVTVYHTLGAGRNVVWMLDKVTGARSTRQQSEKYLLFRARISSSGVSADISLGSASDWEVHGLRPRVQRKAEIIKY